MATASAAAPVRQAQLRENIRSTDVESLMITAVISQEEDETTTPPLKQTTRNVDSQQSQPQGHASISSSSSSSSNQSTDVSSPSSPVLLKEGDPVVPVYPAAATFTPRRSPRKRAALSHSAITTTTTSTFTSTYSAPTATPSTPKSTRRSPRRQAVAAAAAATATATANATSSLGVISTPTLRRSPRKRKATPHPSHQSPKQVKLQSATYETSPTTSSPPTAVVNTSLDTSGSFSEFEEQGVSSIRLFPSASSSPEMPPYQTLIATVREQVVASIPLTAKPAPGKSILRRTNFPSPVLSESSSTSPFPEGSQEPAATTLEQVHLRLQEIFPDKQVTNMPCVAARLFACFTLHQCKQQQQPQGLASPEEEPQKGRPVRQLNGGMTSAQKSSFDLIIPFINALVDLEMALLRDDVKPTQRRVHFAAFDGSAMKPPSDVLEGSHRQQQEYIQQLAQVRRAAQDLNNKRILGDLAHFLREPFVLHGYCGLCAESMSKTMTREYPSQRVQKAAESYATDLELLEKDEHSSSQEFSWNRRMADASAQLVRYWLRTILNPVPDRAPPTRSEWNSRVSEIVSLELQQGESTVAIDDGSLSSLVSDALSHIYDYFGDDPNGWRQILDATPSEFCQSEICHRGVAGKQNKMLQLSANAWKTIGQEIELATGFLAAMNGAQFLKDLLTIIIFSRRAQAWQHSITASASILQKCRSSLQREDAHFCLLSLGPKQLLKFLEILVEDYRRQEDCQNQLRDLEKRFWFGLKARNVRRKHEPHLGYLEDYYLQAMASANKFPSVRMSPQGE